MSGREINIFTWSNMRIVNNWFK